MSPTQPRGAGVSKRRAWLICHFLACHLPMIPTLISGLLVALQPQPPGRRAHPPRHLGFSLSSTLLLSTTLAPGRLVPPSDCFIARSTPHYTAFCGGSLGSRAAALPHALPCRVARSQHSPTPITLVFRLCLPFPNAASGCLCLHSWTAQRPARTSFHRHAQPSARFDRERRSSPLPVSQAFCLCFPPKAARHMSLVSSCLALGGGVPQAACAAVPQRRRAALNAPAQGP